MKTPQLSNRVIQFSNEISPLNLNAISHYRGFDCGAHLDEAFSYLQIGCGKALTLIMLAAIYPKARFTGITSDPNHHEFNLALAKQAQCENVHFVHSSPHEIRIEDLPRCDYIVLQNTWNHVASQTRGYILQIVKQCLNEKGIVFVNYSALPGNDSLMKLREWVRYSFKPEQSEEALTFLLELTENQSGYLAKDSSAKKLVKKWHEQGEEGLNDIKMSMFAQHWQPFYLTQMCQQFMTSDTYFLAPGEFIENLMNLTLDKSMQQQIFKCNNFLSQQVLKDILLNTTLRQDLFIHKLEQDESFSIFKNYYCLPLLEESPKNIKRKGIEYELTGELYPKIFELAHEGGVKVSDLLVHPDLAKHSQALLMRTICTLVGLKILVLSRKPFEAVTPDMKITPKLSLEINKVLLGVAMRDKHAMVSLVSPVIETAVSIPLMTATILLSHLAGKYDREELKNNIQEPLIQLQQESPELAKVSQQEISQIFDAHYDQYQNSLLPLFYKLGIVEPS